MSQPQPPADWVPFAMVRHGTTDWNVTGRVQGHTDIALSDAGRAQVQGWKLGREITDYRWISSPMKRAQETTRLLGGKTIEITIDPRLQEMHWGKWEGRTLAALRKELGEEMARNERRGLDFQPVGGESPREVQGRLRSWLEDVATAGSPCIAVTHKGVIRAMMALASGWDMLGKPPHRLNWESAHLFRVRVSSHEVVFERPNVSLVTP